MMTHIRIWPDPILTRPAIETRWLPRDEVLHTAVLLRRAISDLAPLGIAANQIGRTGRMIAFNRILLGLDLPDVILDPVVERMSEKLVQRMEGCLSLPGISVPVFRPTWIYLTWTGFDGRRQRLRLKDLAAACALHEIDHLDGRTILDRAQISPPKSSPFSSHLLQKHELLVPALESVS